MSATRKASSWNYHWIAQCGTWMWLKWSSAILLHEAQSSQATLRISPILNILPQPQSFHECPSEQWYTRGGGWNLPPMKWYYHSAICHLSGGDRKERVHSQPHTISQVIKYKQTTALYSHISYLCSYPTSLYWYQRSGIKCSNSPAGVKVQAP